MLVRPPHVMVMRDGGHFDYPAQTEQQRQRDAAIAEWFSVTKDA